MDDKHDRNNGLGSDLITGSLSPDLAALKLALVIISVVLLTLGVIGLSAFFIYLCFLHPDAAESFLKILVPGGIGGVIALSTKKVHEVIKQKKD